MSKVFITNRNLHDFSPAEYFGELVYLTDGEVSKFNTDKMYRILFPILEQAEELDYFLPTSLSILNIIAAGMLVARFGKVNILVFDAEWKRYISRTIVFSGGSSGGKES